jgi:hypothetical protein
VSAATTAFPSSDSGTPRIVLGRTFLHPWFDVLVIGGGLSLLVIVAFVWRLPLVPVAALMSAPAFLLMTNLSHFASSTVRLYTKPNARQHYPILTMGLPLATLAVVTPAIAFPQILGPHLLNLYLTWSPYHYAAQAYGLAVMYCYRSSVPLPDHDKRLLRAACLTPFLFAFMRGPSAGIEWFVPEAWLAEPTVAFLRRGLVTALGVAALATPVALYMRSLRRGQSLPLISLLIVVSNAIWWVVLLYQNAFGLATIFHGLQYLAIVTIFHVRERLRLPGNRHGWFFHAALFYAMCLVLAWALFSIWPYGFVAAGFGMAESVLLTVAAINVHHFIVDAYIWRLRGDSNYQVLAAPAG